MFKRVPWLFVAICLCSMSGIAQTAPGPSFTLDVRAPESQEISLTVPDSGLVPLRILRGGGPIPDNNVQLSLSEFTGAEGSSVVVQLLVDNVKGQKPATLLTTSFHGLLLPLHLVVPRFPTPGEYSGTLILTIPSQIQAKVWRIKLTSSQELRPATLVLDQNAVTLTAVRGAPPPAVTVHLRDKTGGWELDGITARVETGLKAPGGRFDLHRNLIASFNGQRVKDIFASPTGGKRSVPAGQQASVRLEFPYLVPGEYTIPLRFTANNSGPDDLQKLTVTMKVRDPAYLALFVLLAASLVSFVSTTLVTTLRRRAAFLQKVAELQPAWLAQEPPVLAVISFKAMVRQVEELSRRYWLTGQAAMDARLKQATGMLSVLDRVRKLRARLHLHIPETEVRNRAIWALEEVVSRIGPAPLSDQEITQVGTELDAMEAWADPARQEATYWADLVSAARKLLSEVNPHELKGPGKDVVNQLVERLRREVEPPEAGAKKAGADSPEQKAADPKQDPSESPEQTPADPVPTPSKSLHEKLEVEKDYQRLRITWDLRRWKSTFQEAVNEQKVKPGLDVKRLFQLIDDQAWHRLKTQKFEPAVESEQRDQLKAGETYAPIMFRITTPGDTALASTFLMRQKLTYLWTLEIQARRWDWTGPVRRVKSAGKVKLQWHWKGLLPVRRVKSVGRPKLQSTVPRVAGYSPTKGQLQVKKVKIFYGTQPGPELACSDAVNVGWSDDFRPWQITGLADLITFLVAGVVALVSGLVLYDQNATFGALKDYLTLFLWAGGFDQGKNFVQALGSKKP